jgi:hypothetical protein
LIAVHDVWQFDELPSVRVSVAFIVTPVYVTAHVHDAVVVVVVVVVIAVVIVVVVVATVVVAAVVVALVHDTPALHCCTVLLDDTVQLMFIMPKPTRARFARGPCSPCPTLTA